MRRFSGAAAVLVCAGNSACSLFFDLGRVQCDTAADCSQAGFSDASCADHVCVPLSSDPAGGGGDGGTGGTQATGGQGGTPVEPGWECLGSFVTPVPEGDDPVAHNIRFEYATQAGVPPVGLSIKLCESLDVQCQMPISGIPQPDTNGAVIIEQPPSFRGFVEATADDTMPSVVYLQPPVVLPPKENVIRIIRPTEFSAIVSAAGQTYDPTRGVGVVLTDNCNDDRSAGVALETLDGDDETVAFYFRGTLPDPEATSTDKQGAGGYLNMPIQFITVRAKLFSTDQFIGETSFSSRAGTLTYVPLGPTPE